MYLLSETSLPCLCGSSGASAALRRPRCSPCALFCPLAQPAPSSARLQLPHKSFKAPKRAPAFQSFEDDELSAARSLVAEEAVNVQFELTQAANCVLPSDIDVAVLQDSVRADHIYDHATGQVIARAAASPQQGCAPLEAQFAVLALCAPEYVVSV